jgi:hypothetical protein
VTRSLAALLSLSFSSRDARRGPPHPDAFAFGVLGDTPYNAREEAEFLRMMERIDAEPLAFVVHVGDFKGPERCTDALYERRRAQFDASAHPFILTPGDNDWTDCRRGEMGDMDPLERLARLRAVFFPTPRSLGRAPMMTLRRTSACRRDARAPRIPRTASGHARACAS